MRIYLAGKMDEEHGQWRDALVDPDWHKSVRKPFWELVRDSNGGDLDLSEFGVPPWPTKPNTRVLDLHDYVGPYRTTYAPEIDSKYTGYFHGSTVTGQHGQSSFNDHATIVEQCREAIGRADLMFAYINSPDCFGTLAEIGLAKALGVYIVGAFEDGAAWDWADYWFCGALCDADLRVPPAIEVGPRPPATDWQTTAIAAREASCEAWIAWDRRQQAERDRVRGLLRDAIVQWTARPQKPAPLTLVQQEVTEPYMRALQESANSFSQIARWTADPRVRSEAQRMLRRITG